MKNIILTATLLTVALGQNSAFAGGCSKSVGNPWVRPLPAPVHHPIHRPVYQPVDRPVYHRVHDTPRRTCSIHPVSPHHEIAPPPAPVDRPQIEVGQTVTIDGKFFGPQTGTVTVQVGGLQLQAQVVGWASTQAKAVLPVLPLSGSVSARVIVRSAYSKIAAELQIELMPSQGPVDVGHEDNHRQESDLPTVSPGQDVTLDAANLGTPPGQVRVAIAGLTFDAAINDWTNNQVTATLPTLQISEAVQARVEIVTAQGQVATHVDVLLAPSVGPVAVR